MKLIIPAKCALAERINVSDSKDAYETKHGPKCIGVDGDEFLELECPWVHEDYLDIKEDKEHGDEIEFHREPR